MEAAVQYFKKVDPKLHALALKYQHDISASVPLPPRAYFAALASSIISQQLSTKAADTIEARVKSLLKSITPKNILAASEEELRAAGLSFQKISYLKNLAEAWPKLETKKFTALEDAEIITRLSSVRGIGRWTAEMFLMFAMARPDVFSYGDLILRNQLCTLHNLDPKKDKAEAEALAEKWSPHRTFAARILWANKNN